jgi:MFS family permease
MLLGSFYGLGPVFAKNLHLTYSQIGEFMGITIFGGMLLQYPVGHLSDFIERRKVIFMVSILTLVFSALIAVINQHAFLLVLAASVFFGGGSFTLYPLSISHATDQINQHHIIAATGGLSLAYGIGAMIGPLLAPPMMHHLGAGGLYYYLAFCSLFLAVFSYRAIRLKPYVSMHDQGDYIAVPRTTPLITELDPRVEPEQPSEEQI